MLLQVLETHTFTISALFMAVPIMTEDRHARDANIFLTAEGRTTSPCKDKGRGKMEGGREKEKGGEEGEPLTGESLSKKISSLISGKGQSSV